MLKSECNYWNWVYYYPTSLLLEALWTIFFPIYFTFLLFCGTYFFSLFLVFYLIYFCLTLNIKNCIAHYKNYLFVTHSGHTDWTVISWLSLKLFHLGFHGGRMSYQLQSEKKLLQNNFSREPLFLMGGNSRQEKTIAWSWVLAKLCWSWFQLWLNNLLFWS